MASISTDAEGRRIIQFVGLDGRRRSVRVGKISKGRAEEFAGHIEGIISAANFNVATDPKTVAWLHGIGDDLHTKLAAAGLVHPRNAKSCQDELTLGKFLDGVLIRRNDIKHSTRINYQAAMKSLKSFFGDDKLLTDVTPGDAQDFRRWLLTEKSFSPATAGRQCGRAREFFRDAIRRKLVTENPFAEVDRSMKSDPDRQQYVPRDVIERVIAAAPDAEWRLLIAMSRYLGVRVPSEPFSMTWDDVDWERSRLRVPSPKTEHHHGKAYRWVPIMAEVRSYLEDVEAVAPEGAKFILQRLMNRYPSRTDGWASMNLRTTFQKIIAKAKCEPWPKLWHNLRASAQTDLTKRFPLHVCCAWLGNSQAIAAKHYLQVTEEHFSEASKTCDGDGALQNPVQSVSELTSYDAHREPGNEKTPGNPGVETQLVPPVGLEPTTNRLRVCCSAIELRGRRGHCMLLRA
jgi:integrase